MTLLYTLAYLDRSNIGNARVAGMEADLNLTPEQYNIVLMMFFITYSLFEPPSNSMLKVVNISTCLSIIVTCWGIVRATNVPFSTRYILRCSLGRHLTGNLSQLSPDGGNEAPTWDF